MGSIIATSPLCQQFRVTLGISEASDVITSSHLIYRYQASQYKTAYASCYPKQTFTFALCFVQATVARRQQPAQSLKASSMVHAMTAVLVTLVCAALVLQPAAAYSFNFGGGKALAVCNRFTTICSTFDCSFALRHWLPNTCRCTVVC